MKEVMASDALEISITAVIGCILALYKESDTLWQKLKDISECSVLNETSQFFLLEKAKFFLVEFGNSKILRIFVAKFRE